MSLYQKYMAYTYSEHKCMLHLLVLKETDWF